MREQTAVHCTDCGRVYSARKHDGGFILPTRDGNCTCGNDTVSAVTRSVTAD